MIGAIEIGNLTCCSFCFGPDKGGKDVSDNRNVDVGVVGY